MRQSKFTETQIVSILKQADAGVRGGAVQQGEGLTRLLRLRRQKAFEQQRRQVGALG